MDSRRLCHLPRLKMQSISFYRSILSLRLFFARLFRKNDIYYINGSETLPPPLSAEEEDVMIRNIHTEEARDILIEHNLRLVAHIVKKYYASREDQDDLVSIGTIGLIKAVSTFQLGKNARFATYACRCIENELLMYFRSTKKSSQDISLSEPIDNDSDGNAISLLDVISSEDHRVEAVELSDQQQQLYRYMETELDDRERQVLILRYGLANGDPMPQREVADYCGISRSYVSRIEKSAIEKLRRYF